MNDDRKDRTDKAEAERKLKERPKMADRKQTKPGPQKSVRQEK